MRLRLASALALFVVLGTASAVLGAAELGATISAPVIIEDTPEPVVTVRNRSTIEVIARLALTGEGYSLERDTLRLAVDERAIVPYTAVGPGRADVTVTIVPALDGASGAQSAALVMGTYARHLTDWERLGRSPIPTLFLLGAGLALLGGLALRRRRAP